MNQFRSTRPSKPGFWCRQPVFLEPVDDLINYFYQKLYHHYYSHGQSSLNKKEPKKLPSQLELESFGIEFNSRFERFETDSGVYTLSEFKHDYYDMDLNTLMRNYILSWVVD